MSMTITRNAEGAVSIDLENATELPLVLNAVFGHVNGNGNGHHTNGNGHHANGRKLGRPLGKKDSKRRKKTKTVVAKKMKGWKKPGNALYQSLKADVPQVKNLENWAQIRKAQRALKKAGHADLDLRTVRVLCRMKRDEVAETVIA